MSAKQRAVNVLRQRSVNALLRTSLRPFSRRLPINLLRRVPVVGTVSVRVPGGSLRLESDGRDLVASSLFWRGLEGWEPETLATFARLLPDVHVLFDVGASTGLFALLAALEDPARRVFAFEPSPETSACLERNARERTVEPHARRGGGGRGGRGRAVVRPARGVPALRRFDPGP